MSARPCRRCGMTIEFIEGPNGKNIPAQKVRTVYYRNERMRLSKLDTDGDDGMELTTYVSHFETCPKAADFSGSRQ